ncbi:LPS-assembly protein LptD [Methyloglobulus sp.]|uniref:LPS-assembly protein LptD n=1 Tax=Methyloglobulus sp. TaxID=2518622 RepID=UPI003989FEAA
MSFANEANWNCQQDKNTKEWVCVGSPADVEPSKTATESQGKPAAAQQGNLSKSAEDGATRVTPPNGVEPGTAETSEKDRSFNAKPSQDEKSTDTDLNEKIVEKPNVPIANPNSARPLNSPVVSEAPPPVIPATQKPMPGSNKPATEVGVKQRGWNCDTKGEDGNWNCQLVGADPEGEARVVETERQRFSLLDPAFDNKQEHIFNTLRDRFKTNPWGNCTIQLGTQKYYVPDKSQRDTADLDMNSNSAEIYDNEIGNYQGNVEMKRADQRASSNSANYDSVSETLDLHGNVFYSEDELSLYTDTATFKLASDEARMRDTLFISPTTPIRGKASAVYRDSKSLSRYKDAAYTSCEPGNQDWIVHASNLKLNKKSGYASAKNAWVEFKGVPVFYSPYLSFPMDDRRLTGFLAPVFGKTQQGGFNFSAPFYWNIAPNYDATIRPRYLTKRGILLAGDFRYLTEKSNGLVSAEYMPDDTLANKPRYLATIKNNTRFTPNISSNLDLNYVSDKEYFSELGNALNFPNFSHIRSYANTSYVDQGISLVGLVESYQTIDPNLTGRLRPYRRLPQLNLNLDHEFESVPANTVLESEYVYFQHDDSSLPDGYRFNIKPSVSFPLQTASAFVTPKLSLQYTQYLLNNQQVRVADSIGRTVPIASIDSGLFFEKDLNIAGNSLLHTLEPRLFYLYIPKVNQSDIPIFDTSLYDFQFNSLFRENSFSGIDRVQDANQIAAALTSRLVDSKTGLERLRLNVGEIFYFQDREVTAPVVRIGRDFLESSVETSAFSPLVVELSSQINEHFAVETGLQWDPEINDIVRGKAVLHFVNDPGEIFNIGYLYRKSTLNKEALEEANDPRENNPSFTRSNDIIQSDISFRWPIYDDWFAVGGWQYSLLYNQTQDAFFGFEKENCCWRFRVIGRQYVNNVETSVNSPTGEDTPATSQTGIFFQVEFKGLTGIGEKLDDFFAKSIYGYRKSE